MNTEYIAIIGIIVSTTLILVLWLTVETNYDDNKKWFGRKLTAKRARKLADKKTENREDEAFDFYLLSIEMAAERGEREAVFREMSEKFAKKLEDLGYEVIYEVNIYNTAVRKHIVKW